MPSKAETKLICINPAHVAAVWPTVAPLIRRAFDRTRLDDMSRTEAEVLAGLQLLWLAMEAADDTHPRTVLAAAITQLINVGDRKICVLVACGSMARRSASWLPLIGGIEHYASEEGCAGMRIIGRRGWERALNGYEARHVILEKDLS